MNYIGNIGVLLLFKIVIVIRCPYLPYYYYYYYYYVFPLPLKSLFQAKKKKNQAIFFQEYPKYCYFLSILFFIIHCISFMLLYGFKCYVLL